MRGDRRFDDGCQRLAGFVENVLCTEGTTAAEAVGGWRLSGRGPQTMGEKKTHTIDLEVVSKQGPGFQLLPRRWVVE